LSADLPFLLSKHFCYDHFHYLFYQSFGPRMNISPSSLPDTSDFFGAYSYQRTWWQRLWCLAIHGLADGQRLARPEEIELRHQEAREWEQKESLILAKYPDALLHRKSLEERAAAHGVRFSSSARAHHRAAILDHLDNPDAPTPVNYVHLTWSHPIDPSQRHLLDDLMERRLEADLALSDQRWGAGGLARYRVWKRQNPDLRPHPHR
jgi:hypothetical protein